MNSTTPQILEKKNSHLKIVKNNLKEKMVNRIYINTLFPNFNYQNHLGETVFNVNKCVLL